MLYKMNHKNNYQSVKLKKSMEFHGFLRELRIYTNIFCRTRNIPPARSVEAGRVSIHAMRIALIVPPWSQCFPCSCAIVPATHEERIWVVDTGRWKCDAVWIVIAVMSDATVACAYVSLSFPIFSPMVTTMRFQPTIVPRPSDMDIMMITQYGIASVPPMMPGISYIAGKNAIRMSIASPTPFCPSFDPWAKLTNMLEPMSVVLIHVFGYLFQNRPGCLKKSLFFT